MPGGDRTGFAGRGPMTGRGLGYCAGNQFPGFVTPGFGRGYCRGGGFGFRAGQGRAWKMRGYGIPSPFQYDMPPVQAQEKEWLREQAESLERTLGDIKKRIEALESEKKAE